MRKRLLLLLPLLASLAAPASLVVFESGRHLKVTAFELKDDDRISLTLPDGAVLTVPLDVVDRIIDDEVEPAPEAPEAPAMPPEVFLKPARSVRAISATLHRSSSFDGLIRAAGKKHQIDPALIAAVIQVESNFAPYAVSRKGARGLMQLMPATARQLGVRRWFEPGENIGGGVAYLDQLAERFGDDAPELILAAYNAGERAVESYGGIPPYRETKEYVRKVMLLWERTSPVKAVARIPIDPPAPG